MPAFTIPYTKRQAPVATVNPSGRQLWVRDVNGLVFCESGWVVQGYHRPVAGTQIAPSMAELQPAHIRWPTRDDGFVWVEVVTDTTTWKITARFGVSKTLPGNQIGGDGSSIRTYHPLARIQARTIKPILAGNPLCLTVLGGSARELMVCESGTPTAVKFLVLE